MASKLGTAFEVLELFETDRVVRLTLNEVAERLGVAKSTASTVLRDLADEGYLARDGNVYLMGHRFQAAFANAVLRSRQMLLDQHAAVTRALQAVAGAFVAVGGAMTPVEMEVRQAAGLRPQAMEIVDGPHRDNQTAIPGAPECGAVGENQRA